MDKESKKITLGCQAVEQQSLGNHRKNNACGSLVKGKVTKITAFGAFVELENGIEGFIHVTELSDQAFGKVEDVVVKRRRSDCKSD